MSRLIIPDRVTIRTQLWTPSATSPYRGAPIAFHIRTFARAKSDYSLGPFFSDAAGVLTVTRRQCELSAHITLSAGLMDYAGIGDSFALVEITHLSADHIMRAIETRTNTWMSELPGEGDLYGSLAGLLERYQTAGNRDLAPPFGTRVRDEWDGSRATVEYEYFVTSLSQV